MTMLLIEIGPTTETDPILEKDHMTETIHTVETDQGITMRDAPKRKSKASVN